ncbi:MAG: FAD-dependent oxidoreductase [Oscillospiraceae bacterium]
MFDYSVVVLGGGPAGLSAAIAAADNSAKTLLIEREARFGGILKQCIHDGFGLLNFGERLTGPEYANRYIQLFLKRNIDYKLSTFVNSAQKIEDGVALILQSSEGMIRVTTKTLVIACGCRERTSRQVFIHGDRPAGIYSAGTAQYFVNILGAMPTKKCIILGSGDIGLIMARRLTLEGAEVLGVYEVKADPSGLTRNVVQCLDDFHIPLHLSKTVTRVIGKDRVRGVEIASVDANFAPIVGTEEMLECDAVILSVGLIPENELAENLNIKIDNATKGAIVDETLMTSVAGVFSCGNALHVNDLVDYVSQSGAIAGENAAKYSHQKQGTNEVIYPKGKFLYVLPQRVKDGGNAEFYFRSHVTVKNAVVTVKQNGKALFQKRYAHLIPSEMECIKLSFDKGELEFDMEVLG